MFLSRVFLVGCGALVAGAICWAVTEAPLAVSPGDASTLSVVEGRCPTFSWGAVPGAKSYDLVVYRLGEEGEEAEPVLRETFAGSASSWTPSLDRCLERGSQYAWSVRTVGEKAASQWSAPSLFQVASGPSQAEFEAALEVARTYLDAGGGAMASAGTVPETQAGPGSESEVSSAPTAVGTMQLSVDGGVEAASFTGDGSTLTSLDPANLSGAVGIAQGGTGATTAAAACTNLGAATAVSLGAHAAGSDHDLRYYTDAQLATGGSAAVHWDNLISVPEGYADAIDHACTTSISGFTATITCNDGSSVTWRFGLGLWQVSTGMQYTCGLKSDGSVACWGWDVFGQATPPTGTFGQVSAGDVHACGLKFDGRVACWGDNFCGQATPPTDIFTQVSAGGCHSCGVKTDGSVACWGLADDGRTSPPAGTFTQVSAGLKHSCGVRTNGLLACWGLGDDDRTLPPLGSFTQVSAGEDHSCGVKTGGSIACWGLADDGRTSPPAGTFTQVSAGGAHSCGVRTNGAMACWGENSNGRATAPPGTFSQVSTGPNHNCGVRTVGFGSVHCWGFNDNNGATVPWAFQ